MALLLVAATLSIARPAMTVPFELIRGEVVAKAWVNGQGPFTAFLDTGTAPSVIDVEVARRIGLRLDSAGEGGAGGGTETRRFYETRLSSVRLGGRSFRDVAALASDLQGVGKKFGRPVHLVLGDSLFSGRIVQFDYPHHVFRILSRFPTRSGGVTLPFRHEDGEVHLIGVRINGKAVKANLDTGSNSWFSLTPRGIQTLGLSAEVGRAKATHSAGFNGVYEVRSGSLRKVEIGRFQIASAPTGFWLPGTGHDSTAWDINIGNGLLRRYVVTIDYGKNRVKFERPR